MSSDREMRAVSGRIEALVAELEALEDVSVRSRVEELVRLLLQLHGEGLARMLALVTQPDFDAVTPSSGLPPIRSSPACSCFTISIRTMCRRVSSVRWISCVPTSRTAWP